jgi:site-specific DNA-methyltransferase (cytosine-N4-specific)
MAKSDIAFSSEFSPEQVDLVEVLELTAKHEGDRPGFLRAIQKRWYADPEVAKNLPLSLNAYGIIGFGKAPGSPSKAELIANYHLTDVGRRLLALKGNPAELLTEFGRHILLDVRGGLAVLNVIEDLVTSGEDPSMGRVRAELVKRGHHVPKNSMSATRIRKWLERCGVIAGEPYRVNEARKAELLGFSTKEIEALDGLTKEQKAYARAFARMDVAEIRTNEVADYAAEQFGVSFPDTGLPGAVLEPLKQRGLVTYEKTTTGRGGKPGIVRPTEKLRKEIFEPLLDAIENTAGMEYRSFVRMPWADVLRDIKSDNKDVKGKALEALAAKLAFLMGLDYKHWRLRGASTGGAEVDLVVESRKPVFLRWNVQCKNTASVRLDDVAKEVGLAVEMGSNVVAVVSTGKFSADARDHAKHVMARTNLSVILMDGQDVGEISKNPAVVFDVLERASQLAQAIKQLEVEP